MKQSLYEQLKAAGIPLANHESDLYFQDTDRSRAILAEHSMLSKQATGFINQTPEHKGEAWLEVPFAFDPYWAARESQPVTTEREAPAVAARCMRTVWAGDDGE